MSLTKQLRFVRLILFVEIPMPDSPDDEFNISVNIAFRSRLIVFATSRSKFHVGRIEGSAIHKRQKHKFVMLHGTILLKNVSRDDAINYIIANSDPMPEDLSED
jgi:hypothetical protein